MANMLPSALVLRCVAFGATLAMIAATLGT